MGRKLDSGREKNKICCFDLPDVDVSGSKDNPIYNAQLGTNIIVYESLTNLIQLPLLTPFKFYGFPYPLSV